MVEGLLFFFKTVFSPHQQQSPFHSFRHLFEKKKPFWGSFCFVRFSSVDRASLFSAVKKDLLVGGTIRWRKT
jgi:hypothetical protein